MDSTQWDKLSDFEINTLVAKSLCYLVSDETQDNDESVYCGHDGYAWSLRDFCNDPSESQPIIESIWDKLTSCFCFNWPDDADYWTEWDQAMDTHNTRNKLRAAMIVFLMMQEAKP